jgi:magnesium transporter
MLVNCVAYQKGQRVADITVGEVRSYMSRPDSFVWVAIKDPEPAELDALESEFDLPKLADP